jgi:pimeloyl-ACP methyl ester carboxylesterase
VVRFDYRGVGESTGSIAGYWLDRPFVEDLEGAVRVLAEAGARDVVLVGSCFGARTILAMADRVKPLIGAVLISTPVRDFQMGDNLPSRYAEEMTLPQMVRKALRPRVLLNLVAPRTREAYLRSRRLYIRTAALKAQAILDKFQGRGLSRRKEQQDGVSAAFLSGFRRLVERRVPVLMLYGRAEGFYEEFERVRQRQLGDLLAAHPGTVTIETIEGVVHGFTSIDVQEAVAERTEAWVRLLRVRTQPVDDA